MQPSFFEIIWLATALIVGFLTLVPILQLIFFG
jgi:hypothetical protein